MKIYFSIVSHGHENLIMQLGFIARLASYESVVVIVKSNKSSKNNIFKEYCQANKIVLVDNSYGLGFGANNNYNFRHGLTIGMDVEQDLFCVLNPDVVIDEPNMQLFFDFIKHQMFDAVAINLYRDSSMSVYDNSIRTFPSLYDFFCSFLFKVNKTIIDKSLVLEPTVVDWTAGSFILFKSKVYNLLSGFDEKFFMYCEDIDICYRLKKSNYSLTFLPSVKGIHLAAHANRRIFSMHFYWHLKSVIRYIFLRSL